jgi:hypothetical protein
MAMMLQGLPDAQQLTVGGLLALTLLTLCFGFVLKYRSGSLAKTTENNQQVARLAGSETTDWWKLYFKELHEPIIEGQRQLHESTRELISSHRSLIESHERLARAAEKQAEDMEKLTRIHITTQERLKFVVQTLGNRAGDKTH